MSLPAPGQGKCRECGHYPLIHGENRCFYLSEYDALCQCTGYRAPSLFEEGLPEVERLLGRALRPEELVKVNSLEELTDAHKAVIEAIVGKQLVVTAMYMKVVTPPHVTLMSIKEYMDDILMARRET